MEQKLFFEDGISGVIPEVNLNLALEARKKKYNLKAFIVLKQLHGAHGLCIESEEQAAGIAPRSYDGDYIITNIKSIAIGVLTADCLPVLVYDPKTESIGVAHAGWRGSAQEICIKMLEHMMRNFGVDKESVQIFFGPSAGVCCYEVDTLFIKNIENFSYSPETLKKNNNKLYFDLALFNKLQLLSFGIHPEQIDTTKNTCTIENRSFCSYRRDSANATRQLSFIFL